MSDAAANDTSRPHVVANVISLELYRLMRERKGLLPDPAAGPTLDERARRISASIERINRLLVDLRSGTPTP